MNNKQIPKNLSIDAFSVRASSWGRLFDCAYAWEGAHIYKYRKPSGIRALLGTGLHRATAEYDTARIEEAAIDDATMIYQASDILVETLRHPDFEVDFGADDLTVRQAEPIGLQLLTKYCTQVAPRFVYAAVEMETKPLDIDCGNGIVIRLTGTMDRSRTIQQNGKLRVGDLKSGTSAVRKGEAYTHSHAAQIGTYCLLTEHTTGKPVDTTSEIIGMKTSGKPEIAIGEIKGAAQMMVGTNEHPGLIEIAANMFRTGIFPPNPSSILCSKKYCARWDACPYHL